MSRAALPACALLAAAVATAHAQTATGFPSAEAGIDHVWALRLRPGQELKGSLEQFARDHELHAAFVVSAVGSLERAAIRYANQPEYTTLSGHFEVVSLSGTLADSSSHLHIAVSDSTGRTYGGHLGAGSIVYTTMEIVLGEAKDVEFARAPDPTYGYRELAFRKSGPLTGSDPVEASALPARARVALSLRAAEEAGDTKRVAALLAPDSRVWFESREGKGEKRDARGKDAYADWDRYFRAEKHVDFVAADSDSVEFRLIESSLFYRLLDRPPSYARLVYWFDARDRITGTLVQSLARPGVELNAPHRMDEFKTWEAQHDPKELAWLLPGGKLNPDLAHAKRWKAALVAWRRAVNLPERY